MVEPADGALNFEASAYLQTLIGRQLFRGDESAIVELVKNAYDAGASSVTIMIQVPTSKHPGVIRVVDNGSGMTLTEFKRLFMVAGYSERPEASGSRVPTGEKGVGRFAADRLGRRLEVLTRAQGQKDALRVDIDWEKFGDRRKRFRDITAQVSRDRTAPELPGRGTLLRITGLRSAWERPHLLGLRRSLEELLDPFNPPTEFSIDLDVVGSTALSGPVVPPTLEDPGIQLRFDIQQNGSVRRRWSGGGIARTSETAPARADFKELAGLSGRFLYFLKRPRLSAVSNLSAGVRMYRDGFRLEPFGHRRADWLGIEQKRAKRAGHAHVVPSRLFGFVSITRRAHPELRDTTSREALIDTTAARALLTCLGQELDRLEERIRTEMSEPRWRASQVEQAQELEQARLQAVSTLSFGLAHELRQPLQVIRTETQNIAKRLEQLGVVDAGITDGQAAIDRHLERIDKNITLLAEMSTGSVQGSKEVDLGAVVRDVVSWYDTRCAAAGIELDVSVPAPYVATVNATTVEIVLSNLLSNALDACSEDLAKSSHKISVSLMASRNQHLLRVVDNANGIPENLRTSVLRKFVPGKTGHLGIGLYNCRSMIVAHGGDLTFVTDTGSGTQFVVTMPDEEAS
jgi:signal transduction histidine kinase